MYAQEELEQVLHFELGLLENFCEDTFDGTKVCRQYISSLPFVKRNHNQITEKYLCIILTRWISGPQEEVFL